MSKNDTTAIECSFRLVNHVVALVALHHINIFNCLPLLYLIPKCNLLLLPTAENPISESVMTRSSLFSTLFLHLQAYSAGLTG